MNVASLLQNTRCNTEKRDANETPLQNSDAKLLVELAQIQATLEEANARIVVLERDLKLELEEEGEDLCGVDESLRDAREHLSLVVAAGRGSSRKARRFADAVEALELITSMIYKKNNLGKTIESTQTLLQQKTEQFVQYGAEEQTDRKPSSSSTSADPLDNFVSNRTKHKPAIGRPAYTAKDTQSVFGNEIHCCCSSMQGKRSSQEDDYLMRASLPFAKHFSFFSVFDGHGGSATSKVCEAEFLSQLKGARDWTQPVFPHEIGDVLTSAYMNFDACLRKKCGNAHETAGSTALSAIVSPTHIVIANLGGCRAVLVRGGKVLVMSNEHKPKNKLESQRIKAAGGSIYRGRVMGELAVSRAFGSFSLKDSDDLAPEKQMVSCQPDTRTIERSLEDDYLVLASDGVWDVMSNEECVKFITSGLNKGKKLQSITDSLLDLCLQKRSRDNMTMMVVDFRPVLQN